MYDDLDRLRQLNRALCGDGFLAGRGYTDDELAAAPEELKELAFPAGSPHPFAGSTCMAILDTGCGAGLDLYLLRRRFPAARLVGIDRSRTLLGVAGRHTDAFLVEADACRLDFLDGSYDLVIANGFFNLIADKPAFIAQCRRLMRPAGRLFIADIYRRDVLPELPDDVPDLNIRGSLTAPALESLIGEAGLGIVETRFDATFSPEFGVFSLCATRPEA